MAGLGLVATGQARKEYNCRSKTCQVKIISKGMFYLRLVGKLRASKAYFTLRFHPSCLMDYIEDYVEEQRVRQEVSKGRNGYSTGNMPVTFKLGDMDEATKKRRKILLTYLNVRDMVSLERAYSGHKTNRVYTVMSHMAQRVAELELMGAPFPFALTTAIDDEKWFKLIYRYDSAWWDKFVVAKDSAERITLMLRPNDAGEPRWPVVDNEGYPEYIVNMEGGPPDGDEQVHEPPVPVQHD